MKVNNVVAESFVFVIESWWQLNSDGSPKQQYTEVSSSINYFGTVHRVNCCKLADILKSYVYLIHRLYRNIQVQ